MITKTLINRYLAVAMTFLFTCTFAKAEKVISLNFGSDQQNATMADQADGVMDGSLAGDSIPANSWNDYSANSATDLAVTTEWDGTAKQTLTGVTVSYQGRGGNYRPSNKSTTSRFMNGYIDDNYNSAVSITVSGIPYATYDVIVYYQGDNGSHKFTSLGLNGKYYTYSEEALKVQECVGENGSYWGTSNVASPSIGGNALRVDGITGANLSITPWHSTEGNVNSYSHRSTIAAVQIIESRIGSALQWTNKNTTIAGSNAAYAEYRFLIPATDDMKRGSVVEVSEIKIAQRSNGANAPSYIKFVIGENEVWSNIKTTESNWQINNRETPETRTVDVFAFSTESPLQIEVGETYSFFMTDANKSIPTNLGTLGGATSVPMGIEGALLWWHHEVSETRGYIPVYEVTAKLVSLATEEPPIGPDVTFTKANDTDWVGFTLPTQAKEKVATGNVSFAGDISYRQTLDGRKATVALVTDAQAGNLIYGLHAFNGGAGLGAIDRDIYLMVTGGTPGVISGGEDANWSGAKTIPTGNLLVNIKGDTTVDYVYGAGLGGGAQNPLAKIDGNIGIVVEENAQVKGSLVGGWQSRHNATPEVTGNVSILIKNIQTHEGDATIQNDKHCVQGFIAGGGVFNTNSGRSLVRGNTSVTIDLPNDAEGSFMKHIVAGGLGVGGGDGNNVTGNSVVIISAPDSVIFPKNIMGGGHSTGTNKAKVGGNSSVTINGGTYTGTIYAAGDNGEHTLVTGTATLTVNDGDLMGATIQTGNATGEKILNLNGGILSLNTISGFTTINIGKDAEICFSDGSVAGNAYSLTGCTTLTYNGQTSGTVELPVADILVGSVTINAAITLDLDNKTVMYTIPSDSTLTRRADSELNGNFNWNAPNSWLNGNNEPVNWPEGGATYVNIDADKVSKIIVDTKVKADLITLTNSATEEGAEFRFETLEDLGEVAQEKENPQCVIEGKLSAAGFAGKLYLQSRITQEVTLGDETRVIFVAGLPTEALPDGNPDEETTAYSYTFKNLRHPIGKIGLGVFTVPSSMYGYQFNVEAGFIAYDSAEDFEFSTAITGAGGIIKRGTGTMTTNGNQAFTGGVVIEEGTIKLNNNRSLGPSSSSVTIKPEGTLDVNAKDNCGYHLILAGGTLKNTADGASEGNVLFDHMTVKADSTFNLDYLFGIIKSGYNATTLTFENNSTITKTGAGNFVLCNVTVSGEGKVVIAEGALKIRNRNSTAQTLTVELAEGSSIVNDNNAYITVAKLIKHGSEPAVNADMIGAVHPDKVELADGGVIETTGGATLSYALSDSQNGTIKIADLGTDAFKLANVDFAAIPETLQIVDGEGTSVKANCYIENGGLFYGSRYDEATYELNDTQIAALGEMAAGMPYLPDATLNFTNPNIEITNLPEGYLAKNIDGTLLVFKKTNSISIKFGPRGATEGHIGELDENVGGFPVMGMFWNHSKDYAENGTGTTEIFKVKDGNDEVLTDTRVFYYCPNTYYVNSGNNHQTTGNGKLTYSYIDDSERVSGDAATTALTITQDVDGTSETRVLKPTPTGKLFWEVGISDVPYQVFDLYIYQASDQTSEPISLLPIGVKANDGEWKYFAGDGYGSTIAATDQTRWNGAAYCDSETMVEGTNYIRYRMSAAALGLAPGTTIENIYLTYPDKSNGRLGLAGIQLVEVEDDGLYTRVADPADMDGDNDERNVWTRENSWKKSNGSVINWPTEGERNVTINADEVKAIKINDVITANGVKVVNNATSYTADTKSFKFLTEEGLDTVATENANPDYILNAPVDATGFCGDLYLQSRISGMVSLGANTHITFVAMEEGEETTAYPYNFSSGTINPIRKIGLGTFKVPESMFRNDIGFNVTGGNIRYAYSGTTAKTIGNVFGAGKMIKDGTGTITLSGNDNIDLEINGGTVKYHQFKPFKNNAQVVVNEGGHLDVNGKDASTGFLPITLNGGYLENNTAGTGDASLINKTWPVHQITVNKNSYIGGLAHFGLINLSHAATKIDLGENTLIKEGTNTFSLCQTTINGTGKLKVKTGSVSVRSNYASSATNATIEVDDGATFEVFNGTNFNVKNLIVNGTATTPNANAKIIVSGVLGGVGRVGKIKLEDGAILDVSKGIDCLTATSSLEFGSNLVIRGGRVGAIIMSGIPEDTILPRSVSLEGSSGVYSISRNSDGNLVLGASYITVTVPMLENASVTAVANGSTLTFGENNTITVIAGTEVTFTYTAIEGYHGGGSITVAINNESSAGLIVPNPDWIKSGDAPVAVIIREYTRNGARVMRIIGLDENGTASSGSTVSIYGKKPGDTEAKTYEYSVAPDSDNRFVIEFGKPESL